MEGPWTTYPPPPPPPPPSTSSTAQDDDHNNQQPHTNIPPPSQYQAGGGATRRTIGNATATTSHDRFIDSPRGTATSIAAATAVSTSISTSSATLAFARRQRALHDALSGPATKRMRTVTSVPPPAFRPESLAQDDAAATSILAEMYEDTFTDITLVLDDAPDSPIRLRAHRSVLVAASRPFRSMFTGPLIESAASEVVLKEVCPESFRQVLRYVYGLAVSINLENALPLHSVADRFEVLGLAQGCYKYLIARTTVANCCFLLTEAEGVHCLPLLDRCMEMVRVYFDEVSRQEAFLRLSGARLRALLSGNLRTASEELVLDALLRWVEHEPEARKASIPSLAAEIRWAFVPAGRLARLELEQSQLLTPVVHEYMLEAYRFQALDRTETTGAAPRQGNPDAIANRFTSTRTVRRGCHHFFDEERLDFDICLGAKGAQRGQFNCPEGIAFTSDGHIAVSDSLNHRVQIFDSGGVWVQSIGKCSDSTDSEDNKGERPGEFNMPGGIQTACIDGVEHYFVCDQGNNRVQIFDKQGVHVRCIGERSPDLQPRHHLKEPTGLAVSPSGDHVFVCDYAHHRVQVYRVSTGEFVRSFGCMGESYGQFLRPSGIAFTEDGQVLVADYENNRLQLFTEQGAFIRVIGKFGKEPGQFERPFDVAVATGGKLLVSDYENHRIQILGSDGSFLKQLGDKGTGRTNFDSPGGIAVSQDGLYVGVTDCANCRIHILSCDVLKGGERKTSIYGNAGDPSPRIGQMTDLTESPTPRIANST